MLVGSKKFLSKIKTQPDIWFFFGFLLTFSFSVRKVLFYFPIERTFNEYGGVYIYLSDIFLVIAISLWLFNLLSYSLTKLSTYSKKKDIKEEIKAYIKQKKTVDKLWTKKVIHSLYWMLPLFLVVWAFISISWSQNREIAFFRSIKFLESYFLYLYIIFRIVPPRKLQKCSTWNILESRGRRGTILRSVKQNFFRIIISIAFFQSFVAIFQVISQHSLGLGFLKESVISPVIPGVAKIVLNGERYVRAYGLMPHPNILGGFLVFSIIITWLYIKLFHSENSKNVPRGTFWNHGASVEQFALETKTIRKREENKTESDKAISQNYFASRKTELFHVEQFEGLEGRQGEKKKLLVLRSQVFSLLRRFQGLFRPSYIFVKMCFLGKEKLLRSLILVQVVALFFTFSKSALIALAVSSLYIYFKIVPRGTSSLSSGSERSLFLKLFHVEQFKIVILSVLIIVFSFLVFLKPDLNSIFSQSLEERLLYLNVSRGTISVHPILGIGAGQFVLSMPHFVENMPLAWQYQPVHNVYLLIWAEMGIVSLGMFLSWVVFLFKIKKNVPRGTLSLETGDSILHNNNIYSSSNIILIYAKAIFLGFLFIMLFDHYFWDIWQGQVLFWLVAGIIAGILRNRSIIRI